MPSETTEIISGGAIGIDQCAREYAINHSIKLTDCVWDKKSHGTKYTIDYANKLGIKTKIITM